MIAKFKFKTQKEKEYYDYIVEHINNVQKAFDIFGKSLCSKTHVPVPVVEDLVKVHDQSKFSKEEFEGYRQWFYPEEGEKPNRALFDKAWFHHYGNNKHHPEHWSTPTDDGKGYALQMPDMYVVEMLLDWSAMSMKFKNYPIDWYNENKDKLIFHPASRNLAEELLKVVGKSEVFR